MKRKLTLLGAALAVTTAVLGGAAHAGATISDKRYWPNEAHSSRAPEIMRNAQSVQKTDAVSRKDNEQRKRVKALKTRRNPS